LETAQAALQRLDGLMRRCRDDRHQVTYRDLIEVVQPDRPSFYWVRHEGECASHEGGRCNCARANEAADLGVHAKDVALRISKMWGDDQPGFLHRIQEAVLEAMRLARAHQPASPLPDSCYPIGALPAAALTDIHGVIAGASVDQPERGR
jgi:hypothetical protein